jgi:hypothetical protein
MYGFVVFNAPMICGLSVGMYGGISDLGRGWYTISRDSADAVDKNRTYEVF